MGGTTVEAVLALLPQTQCRRCGYDDCRGYAEAIAAEDAPVNRCPPGGAAGIDRLARLTGKPALLLDPSCGTEAPRALARVDEAWCIGCALCLKACPVDAHSEAGFHHAECLAHVHSPQGKPCRSRGCLDRNACPYGTEFRYSDEEQAFHMKAFAG